MRSKAPLLFVAIAAIATLAFFLLQSGGDRSLDMGGEGRSERIRDEASRTPSDLVGVDRAGDARANREVAEASGLGAPSVVREEDHPWAGKLAGITGRIVEEDGTPVENMRVELLEIDVSSILKAEHSAMGLEAPEIDEVYTKADGRFLLQGARRNAYHGLNIARGTGRATLRPIEQALEHGALTDLGDIVLASFGTIVGTVIDEDGEPVPGARVRASPLPADILRFGILDIREDIVVGFSEDENRIAMEIPSRLYQVYERLPVPTTTTADDGTFRLEGVMPGMISGGADLPRHVAGVFGPIELEAGAEEDVGEIELLFGRTVTGRVTDGGGEPVEGVEVAVGALVPIAPVGILQPAGVTGPDGRYEVRGIPEDGVLIGVARRTHAEPWIVEEGQGDSVDFSLKSASPILVRVRDFEGEPVTGAKIIMQSNEQTPADVFAGMMMMDFLDKDGGRLKVETAEVEPGEYRVEGLTKGQWSVEARAEGYAPAYGDVAIVGEGTTVTLTATRGQTLQVNVVDGATGEPVANAHAMLLAPKGVAFASFAGDFTDAAGEAQLGPLSSTFVEDTQQTAGGNWFGGASVVAEHPDFGTAYADYTEGMESVTVELPPSCTLTGRVTWAGEAPSGLYMMILRHADEKNPKLQMSSPPRTALTNLEGAFRYTGVAPGSYKLLVMERYLEGDPIGIIISQEEPVFVDDRALTVEVGEDNFIEITLSENGAGPTGRFAGRVTASGGPVAGLDVRFRGGGRENLELKTDGSGSFESPEYSTMETVRIEISGQIPMGDGTTEQRTVYDSWERPVASETTRIDIDLDFQKVIVSVVDKNTGEPVAHARVSVQEERVRGRRRRIGGGSAAQTGTDGLAAVILPTDDEYTIGVAHDDYARTTAQVRPGSAPSGQPAIVIQLQHAVVAKGRVIMPEGMSVNDNTFVRVDIGGSGGDGWSRVNEEDHTFEIDGLLPGTYEVEMFTGTGMVKTEFTLGPNGDENLTLDFANPISD